MKTFEIATKKSKRKQFFKTVGLSIVGLLLIVGATLKTLQILTANNAERIYNYHELISKVAYPNIEYNTYYYRATGLFTGIVHADRSKDLAGIPVAFGSYDHPYDWMGTYWDFVQDGISYKGDTAYDRQTWTKIPSLFNVKGHKQSQSPTNEVSLLKEMPNQLVEVAITFDKPYSYAELKNMLPTGLKKNWLWIGTQSKRDTTDFRLDQLFGMQPDGLKAFTPEQDSELPEEERNYNALTPMKELSKEFQDSWGDYDLSTDIKTFLDKFGDTDFTKQEEIDKLEFAGVILTGRAEDFAQLEGKDWIFAFSIGASLPMQPYYHLDIE
ncbi:hypothetical protein HO404_05980 [Streptococcus suis]|nr:hypothetical protein [Streptococcus suis]